MLKKFLFNTVKRILREIIREVITDILDERIKILNGIYNRQKSGYTDSEKLIMKSKIVVLSELSTIATSALE